MTHPVAPQSAEMMLAPTHMRRPEYLTAWLFDRKSTMPIWLIEKYKSEPLPDEKIGHYATAVDGEFWRWYDPAKFDDLFIPARASSPPADGRGLAEGYIERDFKQAYIKMKERALDAEHELANLRKGRDQFAWLIEKGGSGSDLRYYAPTAPGEWTADHSKACRFARKEDAEAVQFRHVIHGHLPERGTRVCEHGWLASPSHNILAALRNPLVSGEGKAMDSETIQTLLNLLNPLHGELDRQTYDAKVAMDFDMPPDYAHDATVTSQQERDLTQAVQILEDRKRKTR